MSTYEVTTTIEKFQVEADEWEGYSLSDPGYTDALAFVQDGKRVGMVMAKSLISVVQLAS